ncbi:MAG: glutathione S-transferase family protein [Aestuariivirga sp.]
MLTLYTAPKTCSLACAIALEEADADYDLVKLDFPAGEQRGAAYLAKNPKGRVPALATDKGIITEVLAIVAYVAQTYPKAKLAPTDPFDFALMQGFNSYLSSTVHVNHAHNRRGARWSDDPAVVEAMKIKVPQNMTDCFTLIENGMLKGPWVLGQNYSVADGYLFTISGWLANDLVDIAKFPHVHDHFKRVGERAAVKRAVEKHGG